MTTDLAWFRLFIWGTVSSFIIYIWKVESDRSDVCLIPSKLHLKMHYMMKCLINLCFLNVGLSIVYLFGTVHFCQSITASKSVIEWSTGNNMLINFNINMLLCIFLQTGNVSSLQNIYKPDRLLSCFIASHSRLNMKIMCALLQNKYLLYLQLFWY